MCFGVVAISSHNPRVYKKHALERRSVVPLSLTTFSLIFNADFRRVVEREDIATALGNMSL